MKKKESRASAFKLRLLKTSTKVNTGYTWCCMQISRTKHSLKLFLRYRCSFSIKLRPKERYLPMQRQKKDAICKLAILQSVSFNENAVTPSNLRDKANKCLPPVKVNQSKDAVMAKQVRTSCSQFSVKP